MNLEAKRGDLETYTLTLKDAAGAALDLTGASLWFTVKRGISDADASAVFQKTLGTGIVVAAPLTGVAVITVLAANTAALGDAAVTLLYDVQVKLADGSTKTPLSGEFRVTPDVTRAT